MNDKYSTVALFVIGGICILGAVMAVDGFGTKGVIPKFTQGDVLGNSSIVDDLNDSIIYTSKICTSDNDLCNAAGNGTLVRVLNGSVGDGTFVEWLI